MLTVLGIIAVVLIVIDQVLKYLVMHFMELHQTVSVIKFGSKEIFNLTYVHNEGAAWSVLSGKTYFLVILTAILMIALIIYLVRSAYKKKLLAVSLTLIISGGIGNLIDRVFRGGKVIDYIEAKFINFPIFNFADICVVVGAIMLLIFILFLDRGKKVSHE